jgi:hypothetical protein
MNRPFYDAVTQLYWIFKGRNDQGIPSEPKVGQLFTLEKRALFHYPVGQVLVVCDDDFKAVAYARVLGYKQHDGLTRVQGEILKTLESDEQQTLSQHLHTIKELMKEPS